MQLSLSILDFSVILYDFPKFSDLEKEKHTKQGPKRN